MLSTKKFVPHALNARGLHAFRALVATRVMHGVLESMRHPWGPRLLRDGFVAEPFAPDNRTGVARGAAPV